MAEWADVAQILLRITQTEGLLCSFLLLKMMDAHRSISHPTCAPCCPAGHNSPTDRERETETERKKTHSPTSHQKSSRRQTKSLGAFRCWSILSTRNGTRNGMIDVTCKYDVADRQTDRHKRTRNHVACSIIIISRQAHRRTNE